MQTTQSEHADIGKSLAKKALLHQVLYVVRKVLIIRQKMYAEMVMLLTYQQVYSLAANSQLSDVRMSLNTSKGGFIAQYQMIMMLLG